MSAGLIKPSLLEAERCAELARRARRLRQRSAAILAGAPSVFQSWREAASLAAGLEQQVRMAADAALHEAAQQVRP